MRNSTQFDYKDNNIKGRRAERYETKQEIKYC